MNDDTDVNYLRAAALAFQMDDPIRLRLMDIAERIPVGDQRARFERWYDAQKNGRLDPWDVWQAGQWFKQCAG